MYGDSTTGKAMEKAGDLLGNDKLASKGSKKREAAQEASPEG